MAQFILSGFLDEAAADLRSQIQACHDNGVYQIEMRNVNGRSLVYQSLQEVREIAQTLRGEGLCLSAIGSPFGKIDVREDLREHMEQFRHAMDIADILDVKTIRMFSFYMPKGEDPAQYRNAVLDGMEQMAEIAGDAGVVCCHENEKGIFGDVTERCLDLYRVFENRIPGVFDPANFIQCGVKPQEAYPVLSPYIRYLHIKDALLENGQVVPAGQGDGHIHELLSHFAQRSGDVVLSLEPHLKVFAGLENLETDNTSGRLMNQGYPSGQAAFAAAADALKAVLADLGYRDAGNGRYVK